MTDFVQSSETRRSVRKLTSPIADVAAFNSIVQSVITTNPFGCVAYMTAGETHPAVEKTKESYTAKIVYQDDDAKTVGTATHKFTSLAGYNAGLPALLAAAPVTAAHGGTAIHDTGSDSFASTIRCHDPNGELFIVNFSRDQIILSSYEDNEIRNRVETWADTVPALA